MIFSGNKSADSVIKQLLEKAVHPSEVIVVSDDREVGFFARQSRARALGVDAFIVSHQEARRTLQAAEEDTESKKCELSRDEEERINRELRERWLKD